MMKKFTKEDVSKLMETNEGQRVLFNAVVDVALAIQGKLDSVQAPKNEEEKATPTVFISYLGHINKLEVKIYEKGWKVPTADKDTLYLGFSLVSSDEEKDTAEWRTIEFVEAYGKLCDFYTRRVKEEENNEHNV